MNDPNGFYPVNDNGTWRLFVANRGNNSITRIDFGSSLKNTPANAINLGNPGNILNGSTDIIIFNDCNQNTGFVINDFTNEIIQLNFSNLTAIPTATSLGNIGNFNAPDAFSKIFRTGSDLFTFVTNASPNSNSLSIMKFPGCTNSSIPGSTLQNPASITYNNSGIYNISLTVDDGLPTQTTICKQIVVVSPPELTISNDTTICVGGNVHLNAIGANSFSWSPITGLSNSNIANPIATPTVTSKYYVTGLSSIGCSITDSVKVTVLPAPINKKDTISNCGKIIFNGITYTSNTTVTDTTKNSAGCDSIIHLHSIIVTGSSPINIVFPVIEGCVLLTYNGINYSANTTLKDTIKTYQGCDSIIHIQPIIVYPSPSARQDSISGCNSVVFKGITYTSNTNINDTIKNNIGCDSIIYNHAIIVYTQSTSTTTGTALSGCGKVIYKGFEYTTDTTFTDTIRNIHGCDSIYQATNINIHLQPALSAKDTTICSGNAATLMASSNGTIQWLGYNTNPIMVSPINDTEYTVTATNNWGCTDTISVKVAVEHFSISLNASLNPVNKGSNLVLQTSSSIPYSIVSWSSNPYTLFTNPIADVQNITADTTTNYKVEASSAIGCIDSAYITVVVIPSPNDILMIPNAFSPNGDGINDTWIIKGINSFPKSKVTVYDRNGQIVYYDYAVSGFNGYSNGHPVPSGTYYYIIKLNDTRYPYTYSGWLEIVR